MLTIQILTKNNEKTIKKTLESVSFFNPQILIGDYSSDDKTIEICKNFNAKVFNLNNKTREEARNFLSSQAKKGWNLWIEPWEVILQNSIDFEKLDSKFGYVRIINGNTITWNIRIWRDECNFLNPVFERINSNHASDTNLILSSNGSLDCNYLISCIKKWKEEKPLSVEPYYYQSCVYLSEGRYEDFLLSAEHYLFINNKTDISSIMTRYYFAMVQLMKKKAYKPALQNLNLCLCAKPLMAEFWCLTGDVYYHLLNNFEFAKDFYENAIILGSKRLSSDKWPMDISKYNKYPKMMIESCNKMLSKRSEYIINLNN
jgi:tetratricopeptide (TPR) repeat protein